MADRIPIPYIKALRPHAIADEGDSVVFDIETAEGVEHRFAAWIGILPTMVANLRQIGADAEHHRSSRPHEFRRDEVVVPYQLRNSMVGTATDGSVLFQAETRQGIPLQIAMTPDQTRDLIAKLQTEFDSQRTSRS